MDLKDNDTADNQRRNPMKEKLLSILFLVALAITALGDARDQEMRERYEIRVDGSVVTGAATYGRWAPLPGRS